MNLLHLDSSILGPHSVSRSLSAHVVEQLRQKVPGLRATYRDLAANPIPHLSGPYVAVTRGGGNVPPDDALIADLALGETLMQEFLAADIVVIGVAFYNFSIATQLKAWIDRIAIAGKTFRYTESGQLQGLAGNKHIILDAAARALRTAEMGSHLGQHVACALCVREVARGERKAQARHVRRQPGQDDGRAGHGNRGL